jgi:DNA polymerase III alpha subunit
MHAAGVVIAPKADRVHAVVQDQVISPPFEKDEVGKTSSAEDGYLGLKTLTIIKNIILRSGAQGVIDLENINLLTARHSGFSKGIDSIFMKARGCATTLKKQNRPKSRT